MLFLSVRGFSDYAGPTVHSRLAWLPCCLPPTRNEVGVLICGLFAAQSPRPPMPLSTLQEIPRDVPSKTRGQDGFATSFPVGLLHPLQHAGLSRRSPVCSSSVRNGKVMRDTLSVNASRLIGSYALGGKDEYCCRCNSAVPPQDTAYDRRLTAEILQPSGICRRMPRCTRLLSSAFFDHPNARPPIPQTFHRDQKKQPCHQNYRVLSF